MSSKRQIQRNIKKRVQHQIRLAELDIAQLPSTSATVSDSQKELDIAQLPSTSDSSCMENVTQHSPHYSTAEFSFVECAIRILYRSDAYSRCVEKLKGFQSNLDVSETSAGEEVRKRRVRTRRISSSESSEMDEIPPAPKLRKVGPSSVRSANLNTTIRQTEGVAGGSSSSSRIREIPQEDTSVKKMECASCEKNSVLFERLLRQGEKNSEKIEYLTKIVLKLSDDLKKRGDDGSSILTEFSIIESIPTLQEFNESLSDTEKFKEMISQFQVLGGNNVGENVRRILGKMISNTLALQMNWTGRFEKYNFSKLENISKLILATVRKNPLLKECSSKEAELHIKNWLRNAPDREGRRANRKKQT